MPEINNNEVKPTAKFVIPERRRSIKYIAIPLVIIVVLVCAWIAYAMLSQPAAPMATPAPTTQEEEPQIKAGTSFYLATDSEGDSSVEKTTRLYQYSADATSEDQQILETKEQFFDVLTPMGDYTYLASSAEGKLFLLDVNTQKVELLFELAENPMLRNVAISEDKKWLAYARNYEGSGTGKSGGAIWLYNFETKEQKELVKKTELGLYQGFSVLGWRDSDSELIVSGLGGDAGATWGDIYQVNVATGALVKVNPVAEKNKMQFLRGTLSPNGDKWLYTHCEQLEQASSDKEDSYDACTSGAELRTYNFITKETKTVYQNLRYDKNAEKSALRIFLDTKWQDDNNVIAVVPGAILDISIGNSKVEEVYLYDQYNPMNFKNHYIQLQDLSETEIVFNVEDEWRVFDRRSQKIVTINKNKQKETIIHWLN